MIKTKPIICESYLRNLGYRYLYTYDSSKIKVQVFEKGDNIIQLYKSVIQIINSNECRVFNIKEVKEIVYYLNNS